MPTEGESVDMHDIDERVPCASKNTLTMMDLYQQRFAKLSNQRTQPIALNSSNYSQLDRIKNDVKTETASSNDESTHILKPQIKANQLNGLLMNPTHEKPAKFNPDSTRKFLVQTPKIKPVGSNLLAMNFNPQQLPGKLTTQNSTEDLHYQQTMIEPTSEQTR